MIEHALSHHFGRMRRQYRRDQRPIQHGHDLLGVEALRAQDLQNRRQRVVPAGRAALAVFRKIRQHGKQHETSNECHGLIERQSLETRRQSSWIGDTPEAVHGCGSNGLDPPKQRFAAIGPDHIPEEFPEKTNVCILRDRPLDLSHRRVAPAGFGHAQGTMPSLDTKANPRKPSPPVGRAPVGAWTWRRSASSLHERALDDVVARLSDLRRDLKAIGIQERLRIGEHGRDCHRP